MGNGLLKERVDGANPTGMFVANKIGLHSWDKVINSMKHLNRLRSATISGNKLRKPIPSNFMRLQFWSSLRTLDLSFNNLTCAAVLGRSISQSSLENNKISSASVCLTYPLESLNLSGNSLSSLPPLLLQMFPKLQRLVCRGNKIPLEINGGLSNCIGISVSLSVIDLGCSKIQEFSLCGGNNNNNNNNNIIPLEPYPALRELILDGNYIQGTFSLSPHREVKFLQLKLINIALQQRVLERVDPSVYIAAPFINSVNITGNCKEEIIMEELRESDAYKEWCIIHKKAVDRQLKSTGAITLM